MLALDSDTAVLSGAPPSRRHRRFALGVALACGVAVTAVAPFARIPLGEVPAFIPIYQSATLIADLVTAVLLAVDFAQSRRLRLLAVLAAYCFNGFIIVVHTLSFPGAFAPDGVIGGGLQTTAWLYYFWHAGFVLFLMAYAVIPDAVRVPLQSGLLLSVGAALLLAAVCAVVATVGHDWLPEVIKDGNYSAGIEKGVAPGVLALGVLAAALLWRHRYRSVLDLWLLVVMCAWMCDVILGAVVGSHRFDLGFYAGRVFALIAGGLLFVSLVVEVVRLQFQVARSSELLGRTRRLETLGELAGGVAHDFNNLLVVMAGAFERIAELADEPPRVREWARRGYEAATQGSDLTQRLLGFARRDKPQQQVVDVAQVVSHFEPLLRQALGRLADLELAHAGPLHGPLPPVRLDPAAFEAALLNLVINARDAMPDGGRVTIEVENVVQPRTDGDLRAGAYVRVAVRDRGVGMDPEVLAKATEPFFTTKQKGAGTGLGLSQVANFVRSTRGALRIQSVKGAGTSVHLYLPLLAPGVAPAAEQIVAPLPQQTAAKGETVLVVDDEAPVRAIAVDALKALGYRVLQAASAEEALGFLHGAEAIDVLLSDVVMPGMNGAELAVKARTIRPALKVVLTSGQAGEALAAYGVPEDAPFLPKPYHPDQLSAQLLSLSPPLRGTREGEVAR
ncbi:MAG: MASE4 domain-containing protein [Alphaproteobacteria bacterium]|nr:MASE4 domain-containing protein [Alphaproteobacteria bacterium]